MSTTEWSSQRQRRAVALIAFAVAAVVLATAAYLHPTPTSQRETPAGTTSYLLASPAPVPLSPRSTGLIPAGATSVLIQQYGGLNDRPPLDLLASAGSSDPAAINRLVHALNTLPAYPLDNMWCAYGDGSYFAVALTFARGAGTIVKVESSGCHVMYLGQWEQPVAWALNSQGLFDELRGLLAATPGRRQADTPLSPLDQSDGAPYDRQ